MNLGRTLKVAFILSIFVVLATAAPKPSERFYEAIRNGDLTSLRVLLKSSDVNFRDAHATTPLMYAAAFGSVDAMKTLLAAGADVNAKNAFDVTALMWCINRPEMVQLLLAGGADVNARSKMGRTPLLLAASNNGASDIVKLLLARGANIAARDEFQTTPLIAATAANASGSVELLLEKGAELKVADKAGFTPLMNAAAEGNTELVRLLLARGADVNAVSSHHSFMVKNGAIALASETALILAAAYAGPETIQLLLEHGAKVNAQDVRGMTPLMLAISTDRADARVVRLLLEKGAESNLKSGSGETAIDWAKKFQNPPVMQALGLPLTETQHALVTSGGDRPLPELKAALTRSIGLLQRVHANFLSTGGCVSCHGQGLTGLAVHAARANGMPVDETVAGAQLKTVNLSWAAFEQPLLQRIDSPGAPDDMEYSLFLLADEGVAANHTIDAMIHNIASEQRQEGHWHGGGIARPPMEDGDFSRTAMAIRCLRVYGPPSRKAEFDQRIERASSWLQSAHPSSTEDRSMQLLGLKWAGVNVSQLQDRLTSLAASQQPDGGWAQTPYLASDAYATGQVLFTLHELGLPANDKPYQRGVEYLLRTQLGDGSWHVISRAPKFQPYFQSGFPHDHDQWISAAGTEWAAIGLAYALASDSRTVALAAK